MKVKYIIECIIVISIIAGIIIAGTILSDPYMFEDNFLGKWSSVVTISSVVATPLIYFIRLSDRESDKAKKELVERKHISKILYNELFYILNLFDINTNSYIKEIEMKGLTIRGEKIPDETISCLYNHVSSDMYDSLKFSGKIGLLDYDFHQPIQRIFITLKLHDECLDKMYVIQDNMDLSTINIAQDDLFKIKTYNYFKMLQKYEMNLLKTIPIMMKHLKKEFDTTC